MFWGLASLLEILFSFPQLVLAVARDVSHLLEIGRMTWNLVLEPATVAFNR